MTNLTRRSSVLSIYSKNSESLTFNPNQRETNMGDNFINVGSEAFRQFFTKTELTDISRSLRNEKGKKKDVRDIQKSLGKIRTNVYVEIHFYSIT